MKTVIEITQTERQLILYDLFSTFEEISYRDIDFLLPGIGKRMLQRDVRG